MRLSFSLSTGSKELALPQTRALDLRKKELAPANGHWLHYFDWYPGAWQQHNEYETTALFQFTPIFACVRLICTDIGKLRVRLLQQTPSGVWKETTNPAYTPVLRKPNSMQTRIQFYMQWVMSKLQFGNTYVLKYRDQRGVVMGMRILDPTRVEPMVSESGDVFYRLRMDHLAQIGADVVVPAREIIHDMHLAPEHPLVGVSPLTACALAATQGLKMQNNSKNLFANAGRPAGILKAPGAISDDTAARLKTAWETNYTGDNIGKTAVLGDGLEYQAVAVTAEDAQFMEQLKWTALDVCAAFGVPPYKINAGPPPSYNNIEAIDQAYYSQTLQGMIESIEILLDEGLNLPPYLQTNFDLTGLLRMDSMTRAKINSEKIKAGYLSPNEARAMDNLEPVEGGDTPYLQQQNFSLAALAKRDAQENPFASAQPAEEPADEEGPEEDEPTDDEPEDNAEDVERDILARMERVA